jgi:Ca-activated chloride channel homolog
MRHRGWSFQQQHVLLSAVGVAVVAAGFAGVALAQSKDGSQQVPLFCSEPSELVVLPVVVTDRHGTYVSGLSRDRFSVYDNGRRGDIALFSDRDTPVTVGLIVDNSTSMGHKIGEVVTAAALFARLSNREDELFAVEFNDTARVAIPSEPVPAINTARLRRALSFQAPQGRTALYDAILLGLDRIQQRTRPRKILIVISDGGDNASRATIEEVLARARQSNVLIYTIGLFEENDLDRDPNILKVLARETGGERFLPEQPRALLEVCRRIAREIRGGYTIGYIPPDRDGTYHRVRVAVEDTPQKLNVRTRPGYFAAPPAADR